MTLWNVFLWRKGKELLKNQNRNQNLKLENLDRDLDQVQREK